MMPDNQDPNNFNQPKKLQKNNAMYFDLNINPEGDTPNDRWYAQYLESHHEVSEDVKGDILKLK